MAPRLAAWTLDALRHVPGALARDKTLIDEPTASRAKALIEDGTISGGMARRRTRCCWNRSRSTARVR